MIGGLLRTQAWEQVAREADFNPGKMAALCAISERQLERVFRNYLQCTPRHWLRHLQCRVAKELIGKGYSSKAAAAEAKFASSSHFCREFKRVFGTSPKHYAPNHVNYLKITVLQEPDGQAGPVLMVHGSQEMGASLKEAPRNNAEKVTEISNKSAGLKSGSKAAMKRAGRRRGPRK